MEKLDIICDKYNLGTGDVVRTRGMTDKYYEKQKNQLRAINEDTNELKKDRISEVRDYFEFIEDDEDEHYWKGGEWVWKKDGKEKYKKLIEINKKNK